MPESSGSGGGLCQSGSSVIFSSQNAFFAFFVQGLGIQNVEL